MTKSAHLLLIKHHFAIKMKITVVLSLSLMADPIPQCCQISLRNYARFMSAALVLVILVLILSSFFNVRDIFCAEFVK